jgi:PAS domain S-box-containing protein
MGKIPPRLIAAFGIVLLAILAGGFWFYRTQQTLLREKAEANLSAVGYMKMNQIVQWRAELAADTALIMENPFLGDGVARFLTNSRAGAASAIILETFRSLQEHHHYHDVLLADARGQVLVSLSGWAGPLHQEALQALAAALQDRRPVLTDLHAGPGDLPPHIDAVAPFFFGEGRARTPAGAVVLQEDARRILYPLIQSWPLPSGSAESLLVRREGDSVLYLSDPRFLRDGAFHLRIPLDRKGVAAVMAVLGRTGVVTGKDYRGVDVLSALIAVPETPWFLVSEIDAVEALSVWRSKSTLILTLVLALISTAAVALLVLWQRGEKVHYRALYRAEAARRESEAALRDSEKQYRRLFEAAKDGILILDAETGAVADVNPFLVELLGYPREEILGRRVWELGFLRDAAAGRANLVDLQRLEYIRFEDLPMKTSDGRQIDVEFVSNVYEVDHRKVIQCNVRDIRERKRAEELLRRSKAALVKAQQVAHVGSWAWHIQSNRLEWSGEMYRIFGIDQEEFSGDLGEVIARAIHPDDRAAVEASNLSVIRDKKPIPLEYRVVRADGTIRTVWAEAGELILDEAGRPAVLTGVVQDISERKKAEERTRAALQEREVMLREIHHRVKNNIQIISSLLRLQSRTVKDEKTRGILNESQGRIRSMALIHEKLYQSQDFARVDFSDYIESLAGQLVSMYKGTAGRVDLRIEAAGVQLDVNRAIPCGLIINELVTNALKHAFPGGGRGEILVAIRQAEDDKFRLIVKDTGAGLAEGFDLEQSETLGFQIVKDLVLQLEGSIEIVRDEGTEIIIRF